MGGSTDDDVQHGDRETVAQRLAGFASVADGDVIRTDLTGTGAYRAVREYLQEQTIPPQGLVVGTFGQAAAAMRAVTDSGLRVPGDLRIVAFDADVRRDYGQISLATVQQPIDTIVGGALDRLLGGDTPDRSYAVTLRAGESCGSSRRSEHFRPWR
ncbi:substrate-binding domain-containing protein [Tsukamurella soli]|uniref:substrate-binding domain-containing protein n=1 Tax=Tsukamurella soli TaxID=644556 RepID=UPI0036084BD4